MNQKTYEPLDLNIQFFRAREEVLAFLVRKLSCDKEAAKAKMLKAVKEQFSAKVIPFVKSANTIESFLEDELGVKKSELPDAMGAIWNSLGTIDLTPGTDPINLSQAVKESIFNAVAQHTFSESINPVSAEPAGQAPQALAHKPTHTGYATMVVDDIAKAVLDEGVRVTVVAEICGVDPRSVRNWINKKFERSPNPGLLSRWENYCQQHGRPKPDPRQPVYSRQLRR